MPSQTAAFALIELYFTEPVGAPWNWPAWQELAGIRSGLFPKADDDLPLGWSRQDADDIRSWFVLCRQHGYRDTTAAVMPGKAKWNSFVQKRWESWKIHAAIVRHLRENKIHPAQIVVNDNSFDPWPKADGYVSTILEPLGAELFGSMALGSGEILPSGTRKCLTVFVQRSWARVRDQVKKDKGRLSVLESNARAAFQSTYARPIGFSSADLGQSSTKAG
jgi:TATA-binding protein-associated factor